MLTEIKIKIKEIAEHRTPANAAQNPNSNARRAALTGVHTFCEIKKRYPNKAKEETLGSASGGTQSSLTHRASYRAVGYN